MIKTSVLLQRKEGMSVEEFQRHWRDVHGPVVSRLPGLRRFIECRTLLSEYERDTPPDYDGVDELWWDDLAAFEEARKTPEWAAVHESSLNFVGKAMLLPAHEVVLIDAFPEPRDRQEMVKYIAMLYLKEGVAIGEFQRHWKDIHGPINVRNIAGMRRYVQAHVLPSRFEAPNPPPFGGLPEAWFDSVAAMRDAPRNPGPRDEAWPDYCSGQRSIFTKEIVFVE